MSENSILVDEGTAKKVRAILELTDKYTPVIKLSLGSSTGLIDPMVSGGMVVISGQPINVVSGQVVILSGGVIPISQVSGGFNISGGFTVSGGIQVSGTVAVSGQVIITSGGTIPVSVISGAMNVSGGLTISGGVTVSGSVQVSGTVSLSSGSVYLVNTSGNRIDPKTDDPIADLADTLHIGFTYAKRTNPVFITLFAGTNSVNTYMTLESPVGTDYVTPSGKTLFATKVGWQCDVAGVMFAYGYGNSGVADGTTSPNGATFLIGDSDAESVFSNGVANTYYEANTLMIIPANKYPFVRYEATAAIKETVLYGVEVDV